RGRIAFGRGQYRAAIEVLTEVTGFEADRVDRSPIRDAHQQLTRVFEALGDSEAADRHRAETDRLTGDVAAETLVDAPLRVEIRNSSER
ncbi:MAG: hypothetical protein ACRD0P_15225, partial [Stackebrandtia sp.]